MKSLKHYAKNHKILIAAIVIVVIFVGGYLLGYRFGPGVSIGRIGTLTLTNVPADTSVYVDQVLKDTITATTTSAKIELSRGNHTVIVSTPGDYPWSNLITIQSRKNTVANPIFVTQTPNATPLTDNDRTDAIAAIASTTLPTLANPLKLAGGCALVYVSNNQVIADAASSTPGCTPPPFLCISGSCASTIIFSPVSPLSAVLKYPGRQDALVVELGQVLYAIALDPRAPQFFAPILTGTAPVVGALSDGTIVVRNGSAVYRLKL